MKEIEAKSLQCLAIWRLYASEGAFKQQRFSYYSSQQPGGVKIYQVCW
jgi:hypothetical protein